MLQLGGPRHNWMNVDTIAWTPRHVQLARLHKIMLRRRLMRRYFLEQRAAQVAAAGLPPAAGTPPVVDVGCGSGSYSLFGAAHGHRALCFEPDPRARSLLERSLLANNDTGHLVWVQVRWGARSHACCPGQLRGKRRVPSWVLTWPGGVIKEVEMFFDKPLFLGCCL